MDNISIAKQLGRAGGLKRWSKATAKEKKAHAIKMVKAREQKRINSKII